MLNRGEFELDGYLFGEEPVTVTGLDRGERILEVQDVTLGYRGYRLMGRDRELAPEWTFDLSVNSTPGPPALDTYAALRAAWKGPHDTPGAYSVLRYNLDGRTKRVYGRPRRLAELDLKRLLNEGVGIGLATFQLAFPWEYDDEEQSVRINIVPPSRGGLRAPLRAPLNTKGTGAPRAGFVTNEGLADTPLRAVIHGPVTNPWISAGDWRIELRLSLAYDRTVTLDALTQTVLRENGSSVAGSLTRSSRLDHMYLPPGRSELMFGGSDATGTAYVEAFWRNAELA